MRVLKRRVVAFLWLVARYPLIVKLARAFNVWSTLPRYWSLCLRKERGLKFDFWNHLRGLKELRYFRTLQQRSMFHWETKLINKSLCLCVWLIVICFWRTDDATRGGGWMRATKNSLIKRTLLLDPNFNQKPHGTHKAAKHCANQFSVGWLH
jgi:hypothetical protein